MSWRLAAMGGCKGVRCGVKAGAGAKRASAGISAFLAGAAIPCSLLLCVWRRNPLRTSAADWERWEMTRQGSSGGGGLRQALQAGDCEVSSVVCV